jgi:hypothetical protein
VPWGLGRVARQDLTLGRALRAADSVQLGVLLVDTGVLTDSLQGIFRGRVETLT